jgi:hypothetical protein
MELVDRQERGRIPPVRPMSSRMEQCWRPMTRAIRLTGTLAWCISQMRSFCSSVMVSLRNLLIDELSVRQSGLLLR